MSGAAMKRILVCARLKQYKNIRCINSSSPKQNIRDNILFNPNTVEVPNVSLPEYVFSHTEQYADLTAFVSTNFLKRYCSFLYLYVMFVCFGHYNLMQF